MANNRAESPVSPTPNDTPAKPAAPAAPVAAPVEEERRPIKQAAQDVPTGADAASPEYIAFLKNQQELQKCHQRSVEHISSFQSDRRTHQADLGKVRRQASELLSQIERGSDWNLTSKYNVQALLKDASLQLQPRELYHHDMKPQYLDIVQQQGRLTQLKQDHAARENYQNFKTLADNGTRRLERVEKEIKSSQLDATELARLPDTLFIQLDHVLGSATLHEILQDSEDLLEDLLFKLENVKKDRANALDDGEMQLAEKLYNDVITIYEEVLEIILEKIATTEKTKKEGQVFDTVREQYQKQATGQANKMKTDKEKLKQRCEADLKRVFALKERVDAIESQTADKVNEERATSDKMLADNAAQVDSIWAKIQELEKDLERLEKERYLEVKKRIHEKDKDEHRRMEYERFCGVVDKHCKLLDLTISNCETSSHCIGLLGEFSNTGFTTLGNHMANQDRELADELLETHKQHLEIFRGLFLALGELAHKKEKKIDEIDRAIQTSHIHQELAADTFNPNAKKYSDAKKDLLRVRDDVEAELKELKEKAQHALNNFKISEEALHAAGVDFVHPVVEQQEQELEIKAKMVEYKAISIGHVDAVPIKQELEQLKKQMDETRRHVEAVNATAKSSLPMLADRSNASVTSQSPVP